ncbi:MAG: hypothetical protein AAF384_06150 [Pseudomonadota bacterium]
MPAEVTVTLGILTAGMNAYLVSPSPLETRTSLTGEWQQILGALGPALRARQHDPKTASSARVDDSRASLEGDHD